MKNGVLTDTFTLEDVKYAFANYNVVALIGEDKITVGTVDFTIHTKKAALKISGSTGSSIRSAILTSTETAGDVLVPGKNTQVSVQVWNKVRAASTAVTVGNALALTGSHIWNIDISKAGTDYGTWCAKVIVTNSQWTGNQTLATAEYSISPTCTSFATKKTTALEKEKCIWKRN